MKVTKKPPTYEAKQWFSLEDSRDLPFIGLVENITGPCEICNKPMEEHGCFYDWGNKFYICPGNWLVIDEMNHVKVYSPRTFKKKFQEVTEEEEE